MLNIFGIKISKKIKISKHREQLNKIERLSNIFNNEISRLNNELQKMKGLLKTHIIRENVNLFPDGLADYEKCNDSFKTCILFKYETMNIANTGVKSVNLGDYVQTYAVENAIKKNFSDINFKFWDRDNLINYKGKSAFAIMQGYFTYANCYSYSYMPNKNIYPIFIGFHLGPEQQEEILNLLMYKPNFFDEKVIGCRDTETKMFFEKIGAKAYCSRCLSLCLDKRKEPLKNGKIFIDFIPKEYYKYFPTEILENAIFTNQRSIDTNLSPIEYVNSHEKYYTQTIDILNRYKNEASLVITSALHGSSPCIAMGIPTIVISIENPPISNRFDTLKGIVPIYTLEDLKCGRIDFNPVCPDIEELKLNMLKNLELTVKQENGYNIDPEELAKVRKYIEDFVA